ncbi:MAG TPA: hypothetical protein DCL86_16510 [Bacteroidales bacterium]|jgi:hypothetical protein|nr:hypothetical protein [Lentimicrobiaceae bacterium]HAH59745.1 hypothetical protein [Bacteroidales bacterium]
MRKYMLLMLVGMSLIFSGCEVLDQISQTASLARCEFRLKTVDQLKLAGVNIQQVNQLSDLSLSDAARITTAIATGGSLPLTFTLNVEAKNPNSSLAGMNRLDWILLIDDIEMVSGVNEDRLQIPANGGTSVLPLSIAINLKEALKGKSGEAIANFGLNLAGAGNRPTRITLKAKPTVIVRGQSIAYPGYITINNEFTSR